jgi:hypothetical protein
MSSRAVYNTALKEYDLPANPTVAVLGARGPLPPGHGALTTAPPERRADSCGYSDGRCRRFRSCLAIASARVCTIQSEGLRSYSTATRLIASQRLFGTRNCRR